MLRKSILVAAASTLGLAGCADDTGRPGAAFVPGDESGGTAGGGDGVGPGGDGTGGGDDDGGDGADDGPDPDGGNDTGGGDEPSDDDSGDDDATDGEVPVDCSPGWDTPWVGSPCDSDGDCGFAGGYCLTPDDGFPCGTCSQDCTTTCPDTDGAPVTYCINGTDVGLADAGQCLSKCSMAVLPGDGCRDGYACNTLERFDGSGVDGVCIPDEFDAEGMQGELVDEIDHEFLITHFGGDPVNPFAYGPDLDSFQMYLDAVGVEHTSAAEIVEPFNQAAATMCGYSILLPDRDQWERAAALAMFTDALTELVGEPIFVRNWWRPPCYNDAVGGAATGDHPDADALDLDFASASSRAMAQQFLCDMYWDQDIVTAAEIAPGADVDPRLNMSVGLGGVSIHLGVLSSGGRRFWTYASYTVEPGSGSCW